MATIEKKLSAFEKQLSAFNDIALLIGRILIALLFLVAAYNKLKGLGGTTGYFTKLGIPGPSVAAPVVAAFELAFGILLLAGFKTRFVALAIAVFVIVAALFAHTNFADGNQLNHFMKNLAIAGGCLALFVAGAGAFSMDAKSGRRWF
ncbi:MAG: putative oxidoreductase [Hyphomicrobiales bacterium]|jgi:putative oxidoreductase